MQRVIGIDFGTSTTYMSVKRYNGSQPDGDKFSYMPVMFNYGESSGYVASIVRENADGSFDFGEKAAEQLEGAKIYTEIKMLLESADEEKRQTARRITGEFFKFLYETYTQQATNLGGADDTEETVISYPVKWQAETAEFMLDAARAAGFKNVRGMDEATAAVSTVLCHDTGKGLLYADKPGYLMLIDMGAGTTDLVVCKYAARTGGGIDVELVTSWPQSADEPTFGGREIDAALEGYVEAYLTKSLNPALAPMAHNFATIPGQAKKWKELNVSVNLAAGKPVTVCGYISAYGPMLSGSFPAFDRKGFEEMIRSGLQDYTRLVNGCLAKTAELDSGFAAAGLDLVILTGGHSAWYFAREIVDGTMAGYFESDALKAVREDKKRVVSLPNPQTTVSLGLVYSKLPFRLAKKEPEQIPQQKAEQATTQTPAGYTWDHQLVPVIKHFIQEAPAFTRQNELRNTSLVAQMRKNFQLDSAEEIFYVHNWGQGPYRGIQGRVMTNAGIYSNTEPNATSARFMTWWGFLNNSFEYQDDLRQEERRVVISGKDGKFSFLGDQADSIRELHDLLCERAANLQKAAASKQTAKAAKLAQTARPVENESLDAAMKRFNGQVKDAKQQQKAPAKPAQPTQTATQASNRTYKWDDRLLPIVKEFIQKDDTLCKSNDLNLTDIIAKMRISFGLPVGDEIYHAEAGVLNRSKGDHGTIIAASGLWMRDKVFWSYVSIYFTWEMFLNSDIEPWPSIGEIARYGERGERFDFIGFIYGDAMSRLQKLLREKSVALKEGRPIL